MQVEELSLDASVLEELRRTISGRVITARDTAYDATRGVYFTATDRRPGVIVRAANAGDVASVVRIARESGLELAVRNGGHSLAGHGVIDGGIVLDLRGLAAIEIDPVQRIARAGAGLTAGEYTKAVGEHGLATGFGDAPSVGIGGITLSGGVGFLHRRLGMTIDSVVSAEIVTADGSVARADEGRNADLFWAIRGGGGNFGVVMQLEYRLAPVNSVLGGMLMLPATPQRLIDLLTIAINAPDELTLIAAVMPAPPMPMIPAELHGSLVMMVHLVYAGSADAGERVIAPIRALGTPVFDTVQAMRYGAIYDGEHSPHPAAVALHTRFMHSLDVGAAGDLFDALRAGTAPMRVAQFRPLGGALARVGGLATAFAHREKRFIVNVGAMYEHREQAAQHESWAVATAATIGPVGGGAYVAFLAGDGAARIREAYPDPTFTKLRRIKRQYDPTNLFRGNHNIPPAAVPGEE